MSASSLSRARDPIQPEKRDPVARLRRTIIETAARSGHGHIPSALSILDIVWVLYDQVMVTPELGELIKLPRRDRFVLSKGHGCLALYAVLAEQDFQLDLATFCQPDSDLEGHPNRRIPGVEAATGSLGHGAPMSVGMALALKMKASPARAFCIIGDSENEEGSVFEAMHLAARFKLDNLTWIIDNNRTSPNRLDGERHTTSLAAKYQAFGWFVSEVDGHDHTALRNALAPTGGDRPYVLIANTVKGKGVPAMENNPAWHRRSPTPLEMLELLA